jgi:ATP-dependent helicase HrpB
LGISKKNSAASVPGRLLAWAYPDRIARQRPDSPGRFLLTSGRGAYFDPPEPLGASEFLVVAQTDGDRREARIFMAAETDKQHLLDQFSRRVRWQEAVAWDSKRQAVSGVRKLVLGSLTMDTEILTHPAPEAVTEAMITAIRENGIQILPWTRTLRSWQSRVMLVAGIDADGGPWPDVCDAALTSTLEAWLSPYLFGMTRLKDLKTNDFSKALRHLLGWRQQRQVDELAPTHLTVPSGSRVPVDYSEPIPVLAVRIQEMFGATATPAIAGGRMPVMLHLLSPAGRPAQITRDLSGFWKSSYPEVKKALRGRYPKHAWPDDPLRAAPTARAKPRKST